MSESTRSPALATDTEKEALYLIGGLGLAAVAIIGLAALLLPDSSGLEVELHRDRLSFSVRNVGNGPVTINDIGVNDRPDCSPGDMFSWVPNKKFPPKVLQIGDAWIRVTPCQVVRVKVTTDKETSTFSF